MNLGKVLRFGLAALNVAVLWAVAAPLALAQEGKPNVVFILADNVGYGDLGSYGGGELRGAPTPRIDQQAPSHLPPLLGPASLSPRCNP